MRSPYILSGGYNEWLVNFGFLVTDANYKHASSEVYESRRLVNKVDNKLTTITTFYDSTQLNNKYNRLSISSPPKSSDAESKTYSAKTLLDSSNFMDNSFHKEFQGCGKTENKSGPRLPGYPVYAATGNTGGVNAVVPTTSLSKLASPILPEPAPKTHFIRNGRPEEDGSFKSPVAKDFARVKVDEIVSPDRTLKPMHLRNDLNKKNSYNDSIDALPTLNAPGFLNTNGASGGDLHALRKSSTEANSNRDALPPNIVDSADETDDQGSARYGRVRVMSRSHSFPNIADLVETGEDSVAGYSYPPNSFNAAELQHKPIFDRTVKPKYLPTDFESRASFSRDFAPVFRSKNETAMAPGLRNLGNTCFMNAVIQCLYNIHQFSSYFYNEEYKMDINRKTKFGTGGQLCEEFGELLKNMNIRQFKHISPADFKRVVGQHIPFMGGHDQQDSHEFLLILLEKLHADLNRAKVLDAPPKLPENMPKDQAIEEFWRAHVLRNRSIVSHLFEGLIASTLECQHCQSTSNTFEVFSCLSLPIPQNSGRCEISDCLEMFLKSELMSGDTAWDCPKCKQKRESIKKTSIVKLPKVLLIQLKRFVCKL